MSLRYVSTSNGLWVKFNFNILQAQWAIGADTVKDRINGNGRKCFLSLILEPHVTFGEID